MTLTATDIFSKYRTFSSRSEAKELASLLVDPERERPAVVISTTKNGPIIDPAALAERLGSTADVYVLGNSGIAFDLEDALPRDTGVYGGAARSYPPGTAWTKNSQKSMVRLAYTPDEARKALSLIEDDVAAMAGAGPATFVSTSRFAPVATSPAQVTGTVSRLLAPDGVLVKLEDGIARIDTSVLAPGIEPSRLFALGQGVTGTLRDNLLTVTGAHTTADAADHAARGTVQAALVASEKTVVLFPGLTVRHSSGAPVGTVVAVQVDMSGRADGKAWKLSTVQGPTEVIEALPFLPGGKPWVDWLPSLGDEASPETAKPVAADTEVLESEPSLVAPSVVQPPVPAAEDVFTALDMVWDRLEWLSAENVRLAGELDEALREAAETRDPAPAPSPMGGAELERARQQIALMTRQRSDMIVDHRRAMADADELAAENLRMVHQVEKLREQVRTERTRADRARQMSGDITDAAETGPLFSDPADQFRHEVYLEWATRIPVGSKAGMPLAEYGFANGFLKDVADIQGVDRSKIVAVAVEVLTGIADSMPGRDMHRLRGGLPGTASFIEHPEYGTAWRVALQIKTASARRMHFWRATDGMIRFASVGVHDDMGI